MFTGTPDFRPYNYQQVQFARGANPLWLALSKDVDFSRPDRDELKLARAIAVLVRVAHDRLRQVCESSGERFWRDAETSSNRVLTFFS